MKSDIEIAQAASMKPIQQIADQLGIEENELELYGQHKAKVPLDLMNRLEDKPDGKLILVTAMSPTKFGEGKTTMTVGLGQALGKIGKNSMICIREPSLGPVFGIKGGAAGGGYAQVLPMEQINLHFTGDLHAITSANNLLAAAVDNHLHFGNELDIEMREMYWKRCLDMNDRSLRRLVIGLRGKAGGVPREDQFEITAASEVMAILCLAQGYEDLKKRLGDIIIGSTRDGQKVEARQLNVVGAMAALLKDALKPNLVQTLEHTPAFIHGGPFANIAHGCNTLTATKTALKLCEYVVTEAGFGADLGAEKFLNIKCRTGNLKPKAVVIVATTRALKFHGDGEISKGLENLGGHIDNITKFGVPSVVAINRFADDTDDDVALIKEYCENLGATAITSEAWAKGGEGSTELAEEVTRLADSTSDFKPLYELGTTLEEKITTIATEIYGADGVVFEDKVKKDMKRYCEWGCENIPVCMAKTQYSFSDNPKLLGRPKGFEITVRSLRYSAGAGFFVALTGDVMTMPGLPRIPSAEAVDIDDSGKISGLF